MNNVERFKKIASELGELYEVKNKAYGNSFGDTFQKLGIISAVTRISDKFNRLCNLATNPNIDNLGESIEDTLRDMAAYCIMTAMELEKNPTSVNNTEEVIEVLAEIYRRSVDTNEKLSNGPLDQKSLSELMTEFVRLTLNSTGNALKANGVEPN